MNMESMKDYKANIRVKARPMTRGEYNLCRGWETPSNENPNDEGYLVVNTTVSERNMQVYNGYVSWLPKKAFEEQYVETTGTLSFCDAVELLKQGKKVSRLGWNGKDMWLFIVKGNTVKSAINECYGNPDTPENALDVLDAIYMKTADNKLVPWLASQSDILSNDWHIVD